MRKREKEREKERIGDEERERRERERERRGEVSKRTGRSLNTFASATGSLQSGYAVLR